MKTKTHVIMVVALIALMLVGGGITLTHRAQAMNDCCDDWGEPENNGCHIFGLCCLACDPFCDVEPYPGPICGGGGQHFPLYVNSSPNSGITVQYSTSTLVNYANSLTTNATLNLLSSTTARLRVNITNSNDFSGWTGCDHTGVTTNSISGATYAWCTVGITATTTVTANYGNSGMGMLKVNAFYRATQAPIDGFHLSLSGPVSSTVTTPYQTSSAPAGTYTVSYNFPSSGKDFSNIDNGLNAYLLAGMGSGNGTDTMVAPGNMFNGSLAASGSLSFPFIFDKIGLRVDPAGSSTEVIRTLANGMPMLADNKNLKTYSVVPGNHMSISGLWSALVSSVQSLWGTPANAICCPKGVCGSNCGSGAGSPGAYTEFCEGDGMCGDPGEGDWCILHPSSTMCNPSAGNFWCLDNKCVPTSTTVVGNGVYATPTCNGACAIALPPGNITKFYYTFNYSTSSPVTWNAYDPAESSTSSAPSYTYPSPGTYIVAIKAVKSVGGVDIDEALATQTVTIPDANALTCTATATPTAGNAPLSVNFGGSASGGSGSYSYQWHFGDGATSSVATTSYSYTSPGTYHASLNVTDGNASVTCPVSPITITANYCDHDSWSPALSEVCDGQSFTQTNACGETRNATGTEECGCSLSASPRAVITGQPSRLNWSCHGLSSTTTCSLSPDVDSTTVGAGTSGVLVRPRQTTTYTLTCNPASPVTADTQVWVGFIPVLKEIIPQW